MDISNIKAQAPEIKLGLELEAMYETGIRQIEFYKDIEKLPKYPMEINKTENQTLMKALISQVIEELMEGYESTSAIADILDPIGWNMNKVVNKTKRTEIVNHLQNANEEQADAIGFFLSALIYANILPEDVYSFGSNEATKITNLKEVMIQGMNWLNRSDVYDMYLHKFPMFTDEDQELEEQTKDYIKGFKHMSPASHEAEKIVLFQIMYELNLARNVLKNRIWKQTPVMTKELEFQEHLVTAFYYLVGYLHLVGFEPIDLYQIHYRKMMLNEWRCRTQY